jgi:hypothetical protein
MPKSTLGKWSLGLIIAMPILLFIGMNFTISLYESVPSSDTFLAEITNRPVLAITMLAGFAAGVSAFITGLIAIFRQKDRAILAYASTLVGFLFTLYLIAELAFPH